MTPKGNLVIISGFSGVGKGTVVHSLMSRHTGYALSVSCTTRAPRPGEKGHLRKRINKITDQ